MKVAALFKSLPSILSGRAIVITIDGRKVTADTGKLGKKTVALIAQELARKTT